MYCSIVSIGCSIGCFANIILNYCICTDDKMCLNTLKPSNVQVHSILLVLKTICFVSQHVGHGTEGDFVLGLF